MVPNGVGNGKPPANVRPPGAVWQVLQFPMAASSAPRLTSAGSKLLVSGGAIGSSEGRHAAATNPTATANKRTATAPTVLRRVICAHPQRGDICAIDAEPTFDWRDGSRT